MKFCKKCGLDKSNDSFYKNNKLKSGLTTYCKECIKNYYHSNNQSIEVPKQKKCYKCKLTLDSENFYRGAHLKDGLFSRCKKCLNRSSIISRFNITENQYEEFMRNGCQACGSFQNLCIDHDHYCCPKNKSCGKCVRGVLCSYCNSAEGFIKSQEQLEGLLNYMKKRKII